MNTLARQEMASGTLPPEGVREMFDRVSPVYDLMNRVATVGLDGGWRRLAAESVVRPGNRVLDACCGTGDLAIAAERAGGTVTGVDFSERMLGRAQRKSTSIAWVQGDVTALPFEDASFDVVTVGFGIRNVPELERGLRELARVLRAGGRLACLDLTRPRGLAGPFFRLWFDRLIPLAGKVLPGGAAYTYLPASVRRFPDPESLAEAIHGAGFSQIRWRLLAAGIVVLHTAERSKERAYQNEALGRRAALGGPRTASSVAPVSSGYERDAASLPRTTHHSPATKRHSDRRLK